MLKKLSEKLGAKFPATTPGMLHSKNYPSHQIRGNLAEIQPKNYQNVQKTQFLQKVPGVNGLS